MITLTKEFRFEAAHRLAKDYPGKAKSIHGHSWRGHYEIGVEEFNEHDMAVDTEVMHGQMVSMLDYRLLLHQDDAVLRELCKGNGYAFITFTRSPTAEVVARFIYNFLKNFFRQAGVNGEVYKVVIEETCTGRVEYSEKVQNLQSVEIVHPGLNPDPLK